MGENRRHVNDRSSARLQHGAGGEFVADSNAGEVDVNYPPPFGEVELVDRRFAFGNPGIGDENVEPAKARHGRPHQRGDAGLVDDIRALNAASNPAAESSSASVLALSARS